MAAYMGPLRRATDKIPSLIRQRTTVVGRKTVVRLSESSVRKALNSAVVIQFPHDTAPTIAELADLTPEGGKKIAKGEGGMSLRTYFSIRLNHPEFDAEIMRLLTGDDPADDIERRLTEIETRLARGNR